MIVFSAVAKVRIIFFYTLMNVKSINLYNKFDLFLIIWNNFVSLSTGIYDGIFS